MAIKNGKKGYTNFVEMCVTDRRRRGRAHEVYNYYMYILGQDHRTSRLSHCCRSVHLPVSQSEISAIGNDIDTFVSGLSVCSVSLILVY